MNEWIILPNKLILDTNNMSELIGKYKSSTSTVFKVEVVGNLISTLAVGF